MTLSRIIIMVALAAMNFPTWADEPTFSLRIAAGSHGSLTPVQEAQRALWNDPMIRLMRAMDAEIGHLLIGQPGGGRTPPLVSVGLGGGLPPRVLTAAIDRNLSGPSEPPTAVAWPWHTKDEPPAPPMEEQLALLLGKRLEQRLGSGR